MAGRCLEHGQIFRAGLVVAGQKPKIVSGSTSGAAACFRFWELREISPRQGQAGLSY